MTSLIILGSKHHFTSAEQKKLLEVFQNIQYHSYKNKAPDQTIDEISSMLKNKKSIIVLNTKARIPNALLRYLVGLENKGVAYIDIECFIEKYLQKCYIPNEQTNISFLAHIRPYSPLQSLFKRGLDMVIGIPLLLLSLPMVLYSIYRIKRESPGHILFKQSRVGLNNKEFTCYKLRSMYLDAEKDGAKFASTYDDRVFPWGQIMRKTRIDELPQLWNVLRGEMHIIGPRPERKLWIEKFEQEIPYYNERHIVKPGITGWAQVNYPYGTNTLDAKQKLMYDLYYIKHWNLWLEAKVIIKTIFLLFDTLKSKGER